MDWMEFARNGFNNPLDEDGFNRGLLGSEPTADQIAIKKAKEAKAKMVGTAASSATDTAASSAADTATSSATDTAGAASVAKVNPKAMAAMAAMQVVSKGIQDTNKRRLEKLLSDQRQSKERANSYLNFGRGIPV